MSVILCQSRVYAKIIIKDDTGFETTLEKPATRIIALYGAFNEILLSLGLDSYIVARTKADARFQRLKDLPVIGTHMRPNPELIIAQRPDIVLQMIGRQEASNITQALRSLGVPVLSFNMTSFNDIFAVLEKIGQITNTGQKAAELKQQWQARLDSITQKTKNNGVSVFYEVRYPNLLAAGQGSIVNDIIHKAGGQNVVTGTKKIIRLNEEELIKHNPDFYIIQKGPMNPTPSSIYERKHYRTLNAVINNKVLIVDEFVFSRPGPSSIKAVEILSQWLNSFQPMPK